MHNNHNYSSNTPNSSRKPVPRHGRKLALGGLAVLAGGGIVGGAWRASIDSHDAAPASITQTGILSTNRIPDGVELQITLKNHGEVSPAVRSIYEAFGQSVDDSFVNQVAGTLVDDNTATNNQAPGATYHVWVEPGHQLDSEKLAALNKEFPQESITIIDQTPEAK
jgi:hypothetical protein